MAARLPVLVAALSFAPLLGGCGKARPVDDGGVRQCVAWEEEIGPAFASRCSSCHSAPDGGTPAGNYDTTNYLTVLKNAGGMAIVTPGDASSPLLATLDPAQADATHQPFSDLYPQLVEWVVQCDASYLRSPIHEKGLMNPDDPEFHGNLVKNAGWSFTVCQGCHGMDFKGGGAGVSCYQCHKDGPTGCTTCHGQPPATGAHVPHVLGSAVNGAPLIAKGFDCTECHVKPMVYTDVGHLFAADGTVIDSPQMHFGALANLAFGMVPRKGPPAFDHDAAQCTNVYCHGGAFADSNGTNQAPRWVADDAQVQCGTCHGLPPAAPHPPIAECVMCHPKVVDADKKLVDRSRHIDGQISLGDESGKCNGCHGGPDNPAPPRDLHGNTDPTMVSVGLHQNHVRAASGLSAPVPCSACHLVPSTVYDAGHIDAPLPARVFPATPAYMGQAIADGAMATWDHDKGTCTNVYCHGGGTKILADQTPTIQRIRSWTDTTAKPECGTCHGIPPQDGLKGHVGASLATCFQCHPSTIDAHGDLIVTGAPGMQQSTHINGVVEHVP